MNKLLIVAFLLTLAFASCKKDNSTPLGTITADVDGVTTSFNILAKAYAGSIWGEYQFGIEGEVVLPQPFNTSTNIFVSTVETLPPAPIKIGLPYVTVVGFYTKANNTTYSSNYYIVPALSETIPPSITYTLIMNNTVQGIFSGTVYSINRLANPNYYNITNGKFYVRIE